MSGDYSKQQLQIQIDRSQAVTVLHSTSTGQAKSCFLFQRYHTRAHDTGGIPGSMDSWYGDSWVYQIDFPKVEKSIPTKI